MFCNQCTMHRSVVLRTVAVVVGKLILSLTALSHLNFNRFLIYS